ncbi:hypothetical protein L13192_11340, partial [Pyrenophora tritici-repentis]
VMMLAQLVAFALSENFWILLLAAVFGIISVTGADCGPFRAVEESILSGLTDDKTRSDVLACGNVTKAYHTLFWGYAAFGVLGSILCLCLSNRCEVAGEKHAEMNERGRGGHDEEEEEVLLEAMTPSTTDGFEEDRNNIGRQANPRVAPSAKKASYFSQISKPTRSIMFRLWILLAIDSLADGMTPYSLMNYYVEQKFHVPKTTLGDITSASQFLCAVGAIFAGPLAKRIGLINTMVFTHIPSSLASAFIPLPSGVGWTVGLLLFRAALNSMDQAPRAAFIAAVVKPEERTGVMGITGMLRTLAASAGPSITGFLSGHDNFWIAFLASGACRITYDLGLWVLFVNVKVNKDAGREDDVESLDDEALAGLVSDTDSDDESDGRKSKDSS